jgi:hypothetical protein
MQEDVLVNIVSTDVDPGADENPFGPCGFCRPLLYYCGLLIMAAIAIPLGIIAVAVVIALSIAFPCMPIVFYVVYLKPGWLGKEKYSHPGMPSDAELPSISYQSISYQSIGYQSTNFVVLEYR